MITLLIVKDIFHVTESSLALSSVLETGSRHNSKNGGTPTLQSTSILSYNVPIMLGSSKSGS